MENCQRCSTPTNITIMSMFNTQTICMGCKKKEESHPDYECASKVETEAVKSGDMNFPGIGWKGV